ncbi:hypothetical protein COV53_00045 [Candidatus Gottesmanbacteria bacterium CG11_big_fil_rev_8_21_14_0_20_37_11]|uniref:Uncharacterized protein n=3 Tax=Candidatus Gottesmaniibacteriota TaxID=1752720 RepID=A0A2M7RPQ8_9BACT|nr:MAG: hypothetical protein AUJ73_03155 [Candidatus Gottesmanbacteria bacterium CG1_02_37_22]PIP33207.1 MAG: hypothetical protein COX23_00630 [Candidatus Gottesmanbacteria bacterium CG23_combo_of_CG06-09_8_20_14_all_37_19]PIR08982.1 MAG: hypothetical protein COV53_00045 [Candidatus Gottesmanbacteria bacterium CG11_big_fil_rev_8_21_14_0_20_37_11]PIZ02303.1 MAG: hypothetical protein COY59_05475 [Candidatus Gottesmanbacteria bacterium CG_4_10_14_0_8_um_filter_37_24]
MIDAVDARPLGIEPEILRKAPLDAVIVCGMGPVALRKNQYTTQTENPVADNPFNFLNALAAKLLVGKDLAGKVILSGFTSAQERTDRNPIEQGMSEAELLEKTTCGRIKVN